MMTTLPVEIQEHILSYLPFVNLIPLRRVSRLWDFFIFRLISRSKPLSYLTSWSMLLTTSLGRAFTIPLDLESINSAKDWSDIYRRPYIFSGPVSGILRTDRDQILKFQFWDAKQGEYVPWTSPDCRYRCCGLCDITLWPWSTLPVSRQGPLGEVITWRNLYRIDLWESHWDQATLRQRSVEQHIGVAWHGIPAPPIVPVQPQQQGYTGIYMASPVQMTNDGHTTAQGPPGNTFAPNRIRIILSYSAICLFLVLQRRKEEFLSGKICLDPMQSLIQDPKMRELITQTTAGCGCKLVDWNREDLGIRVIRLEDLECNSFDKLL
jgi:hypothetical protein